MLTTKVKKSFIVSIDNKFKREKKLLPFPLASLTKIVAVFPLDPHLIDVSLLEVNFFYFDLSLELR